MKPNTKRFTLTKLTALALFILGLAAAAYRFAFGLGAATNLSDNFPWGLWIAVDVMAGVALAAGGFVMTFLVYILNLERFRPLVRPAVLTAFIGYILSATAILLDLGQPQRIWHPLVTGNVHSPLFEVALCVMAYLLVLALEFGPNLLAGIGSPKAYHALKGITIPLVFIGITLSTLHQSSLGTLLEIAYGRQNPLWYSAFSPVLFFVSAVAAGLAMTTLESFLSSRAYRRPFEADALASLARGSWWVLLLYFLLRVGDLTFTGRLGQAFTGGAMGFLFLAEMLVLTVAPLVLLRLKWTQATVGRLFGTQLLVVLGVIMNRIDSTLFGMAAALKGSYFPSLMEFAVTIGMIAFGVLAYSWAVEHLPVFATEHEAAEAARRQVATARQA